MKKIQNKFFDLILLLVSFFFSLYRSILGLLGIRKEVKRSSFFDIFDYIFRLWPRNFWKKPNFLKIGLFLGSLITYIFYNNKK